MCHTSVAAVIIPHGSYRNIDRRNDDVSAERHLIVTQDSHVSEGSSTDMVALLAKPDPLNYFNLLELLCRMAPWDNWGQDDSSILLQPDDSFRVLQGFYTLLHLAVKGLKGAVIEADQGKQQQQRPWWQLWKAAASTYASWTKAYIRTLKAVAKGRAAAPSNMASGEAAMAAAGAAAKGEAQQSAAEVEGAAGGAAAGWVASPQGGMLMGLLDVLFIVPAAVGWASISPGAITADDVKSKLLLLLWGARVVAATVEQLMAGPSAASEMNGSGDCNLVSRSTERTRRASNSGGSSSSTSVECFSFSTNPGEVGSGSSSSSRNSKVEESGEGNPVAPSRAGHTVTDPDSSAMVQDPPERVIGLDAALKVALAFYDEVHAWTKCAAEVAAAAPTAGAVPSSLEPLGNDERLLSQRLVHIPASLPPSVASHVEHIYTSYVEKLGSLAREQLAGESRQWKLQLLHDLLRLAQMLLEEVPCTIGCSNPTCVALSGASEVKVSCKACTGCKVVYYCSRECQVAHWKLHKGICKKLSGSDPSGSESVKGRGKQGAAGKVTASK